jgi:ribosomal protein S18 acetylase RimI-like enzyme
MMDDRYLDEEVAEERRLEWQRRMSQPNPEQYIVMAMDGDQFCGFACVYLNHHPEWGALLDNLHVLPAWKRRGIARELIRRTARWVKAHTPNDTYYLLVLKGNKDAIAFYDRMGGKNVKELLFDVPYDRKEPVYLYLWDDWDVLLD